ncbi:MAG: energy transducer TonB [Terriglobia bacterium]
MTAASIPLKSGPLQFRRRESLQGSLVASVLAHVALVVVIVVYSLVSFRRYLGWGNRSDTGSAIHVNMVSSLPGVPLPKPMVQTPNAVVTQNPGLYQAEPQRRLTPPPDATKIPKFKDLERPLPLVRPKAPSQVALTPERQLLVNKRIQHQASPVPPNAIPTGAEGTPAMNYGQIVNNSGNGAVLFKGGDFGQLYGWYIEAVKNRISANWLLSIISPSILSARRVYVEFDILRDGSISGVRLRQSSGIAEVDRSALRAVYASSPLPALPPGYNGHDIHVDFYFDFHR